MNSNSLQVFNLIVKVRNESSMAADQLKYFSYFI